MRIAKIEKDCLNNGPGIRLVVWCQGCSVHCPGCHNKETWNEDIGHIFNCYDADEIYHYLKNSWVSGITLTGGHPLEPYNIDTCTELCKMVKLNYPDKTVWLYTGWLWEDIKELEIMKYVDVVVDGPFIESERDTTLAFRGSKNQRIIDVRKTCKTCKE